MGSFSSRAKNSKNHALEISNELGIQNDLWERDWTDLSGGEAQRIVMSIAIGLNAAEILLLDGRHISVLYLSISLLTVAFRADFGLGFRILCSGGKNAAI